jgi:glycosyltransferase involved in cell wall biosynthesis
MFTLEKEPLLSEKDIPTKFNFLCAGQWTYGDRKNITQTIYSFLKTFKGNNDVGLIVKAYGIGAGTIDKIQCVEKINFIRNRLGLKPDEGPKVYLVHGSLTTEEMARLYHNAQVFVLPSSGEAFGMPLAEAAASGLPIITTGGTAPDFILNPEKSVLLNYKQVPLRQEMFWQHVYEPGMQMTMPDFQDFERMMMRSYERYSDAKKCALEQRQELIDRHLTWENSAEKLALFLDSV